MSVVFENRILKNDGVIIKEFDYPIAEIVAFEKAIVVLVSRDFHKKSNENVYCVNYQGEHLWQVPEYSYAYPRSPFISLKKEGNNVKLCNWDSSFVLIEPETGKVLVDAVQSRQGKRPW